MRRTRLRPGKKCTLKPKRNADGKAKERFEGLRDEDYREWIRNRACLLDGHPGTSCYYATHRSEAAHVKSKATGNGDAGQLVSLCTRHHRDQHDFGAKSFQRQYDINLRALAGALWIQFEAERGIPTL